MATKRQRAGWIDKQIDNFNMRRGRRGKAIWGYFNRYKELFYDKQGADKQLIGTGHAAQCKYCHLWLCADPTTLVNHIIEVCDKAPINVQQAAMNIRQQERIKRRRKSEQTTVVPSTSVPILPLPTVNSYQAADPTTSVPLPSSSDSPSAHSPPSATSSPTAPSALSHAPPTIGTAAPIDQQQCKRLDFLLAKWVITQGHEFNIVEEPEFRELIAALQPQYQLPSRKVIAGTLLDDVYGHYEGRVKKVRYSFLSIV